MVKHLKYIDALRGIAASWVVFFHIWNRYYPEMNTQNHAFYVPDVLQWNFVISFLLFQYGYIGVTLFFVLSGFCIHLPQAKRYAQSGSDQLSIKDFGKRRFWRLYPAYWASIVLSAVALGFYPLLLGILNHQPVNFAATMDLRGAFFNAFFLQQFAPDTLLFNGVYWTLLFEVQFYAFYPALLWLIRRAGLKTVFCILLVAEVTTIFWAPPIKHVFFTRYYEWFLGLLAAEWYVSGRCPISPILTAWAGILAGIAVTLNPFLWSFRDVLLATGFFGLLLHFVRVETNPAQEKALNFSKILDAFVPVGLFSYSLYLIHIPIIDVIWTGFRLGVKYGWISANLSNVLSLISVPIAFFFAYNFYLVFEKPFLQTKKK